MRRKTDNRLNEENALKLLIELTEENAALKRENEALRARLGEGTPGDDVFAELKQSLDSLRGVIERMEGASEKEHE